MKTHILLTALIVNLYSCSEEDKGRITNLEDNNQITTEKLEAQTPKTYYLTGDSSMIETVGIEYHSNGRIKSITEGGDVNTCGTPVGTHYYFDESGNLIRKERYDVWILNPNEGCHTSVIQDKYIVEFYTNGKLKSKKQVQSVYEGEDFKFGYWEEFDLNGKLVEEKFFKRHYSKENIP